jgi:hypothetical protein
MHLHVYDSCVFKSESTEQVGLAVILHTCIQDILDLGSGAGHWLSCGVL